MDIKSEDGNLPEGKIFFLDGKPLEIILSKGKIKFVSSAKTCPENVWMGLVSQIFK